jgi:hypothetical protein
MAEFVSHVAKKGKACSKDGRGRGGKMGIGYRKAGHQTRPDQGQVVKKRREVLAILLVDTTCMGDEVRVWCVD